MSSWLWHFTHSSSCCFLLKCEWQFSQSASALACPWISSPGSSTPSSSAPRAGRPRSNAAASSNAEGSGCRVEARRGIKVRWIGGYSCRPSIAGWESGNVRPGTRDRSDAAAITADAAAAASVHMNRDHMRDAAQNEQIYQGHMRNVPQPKHSVVHPELRYALHRRQEFADQARGAPQTPAQLVAVPLPDLGPLAHHAPQFGGALRISDPAPRPEREQAQRGLAETEILGKCIGLELAQSFFHIGDEVQLRVHLLGLEPRRGL